jgi:hypothetical protein
MIEQNDPHTDWRRIADTAVVSQANAGDFAFWDARLQNRYDIEVRPGQEAAWRQALGLLAVYGQELCWLNGPIENHPAGAALSTGALLLGEPTQYGDALVMNTLRLSVGNSYLTAKELFPGGRKPDSHNAVIDTLHGNDEFTILQCAAFVLATTEDVLTNNDAMRDTLHEATPPRRLKNRMTFSSHFSDTGDMNLKGALQRHPQVALWSRPLAVFVDGSNRTYLQRPQAPQLYLPPMHPWKHVMSLLIQLYVRP